MDEDWNKKYTAQSLVEELALLERHYRDGSWSDCSCIPEKHLPLIAGLASEMVMFVSDESAKRFYENLADVARKARIAIEEEGYTYLPSNPERRYLPHGLTSLERASSAIRHKLSRCIKKVEAQACPRGFTSYHECSYNPVAVCRASVEK